jgi:hypothetical protein
MPLLTGDELMSQLDLNPQPSGYFHGYNASIDASIANSFAASAFRFGHTLLPVSPALAQPVHKYGHTKIPVSSLSVQPLHFLSIP